MVVEHEVAGRTLRARCKPRNAARAVSALRAFERVADLEPGLTLRFGWSLLRLESEAGGALLAHEPEYGAWPPRRWQNTIDTTLDVLEEQVRLLQRTGAGGQDVAVEQVLLAAPGAIDEPRAFMRRVDPIAEQDSGWLVGPVDDPEALSRTEELETVAVAALVARRRALLQALTLPVDHVVIFDGPSVAQVLDPSGRELLTPGRTGN